MCVCVCVYALFHSIVLASIPSMGWKVMCLHVLHEVREVDRNYITNTERVTDMIYDLL